MKHLTTVYYDWLHLPSKAYQLLNKIQKHREKSIRDTAWTREVSLLLLSKRGNSHHGSQPTGRNLQEGFGHIIIGTSMHTTIHLPIKNQDTIQTWTRSIHDRLVMTESWRRQGQYNTWHEDKHWGGTHSNGYPRAHSIQDVQQTPLKDEHLQQLNNYIIQGWPLSRNKSPQKTENILKVQGWSGSVQQYNDER